jgi:hypothetical protein
MGGGSGGALQDIGQTGEERSFALGGIAGFEQIKSVGQKVLPVFEAVAATTP